MNFEIALVLLLLISAVAAATRYLRVPYPVALVLTGLGVGALARGGLPVLRTLEPDRLLTPYLVLTLLLPALLFEATLHIEARALRRTIAPIALLAVPGVILTAAIVGALVHWGVALDWGPAFLFGAIVAATDPIAVLPFLRRLPRRWLHAVFWSGPRGAVSLAVVLALPAELPARGLLINLTFGVVLFTLLSQALTMERLLGRLGITGADAQRRAYLTRRAQVLMVAAAERELERLSQEATISPHVYDHLKAKYSVARDLLNEELEDIYRDRQALLADETRTTREHLLRIERTTLLDLQRRGMIDTDTAGRLMRAVDERLLNLPEESLAALDEAALSELDPSLTGEEGTFVLGVDNDGERGGRDPLKSPGAKTR